LRRWLLPSVILLLTGCTDPDAPEEAPVSHDVVINNVTVIDALSPPRPGQRVTIDDGLITTVGPMSDESPAGESVLDADGRYLIPGLWDMHVHFLYDEALTSDMADLFIKYGVTSVRDTGGDVGRMSVIAQQLTTRDFAPRLFYSGPLLDGRFVVYDGGDPGRPELGTSVANTDAAEAQVEQLQSSGASFIKIYELVAPEVFTALANAAAERNMPIASHVPLMMTADQAGPLADSMEHLRNIELACAADWRSLLATRQQQISGFTEGRGYDLRRNLHSLQRIPAIKNYDEARCDQVLSELTETIQVPTLRLNTVGMVRPFDRDDWADALADLPPAVQESWQESADRISAGADSADHTFAEWSLFLISRLAHNGVPIVAGTDTPIGLGIPGYSLHTELELLVEAGLSPAEALHAATVEAAGFFDLEEEIGTIAPGMRADLLLLTGNPLDDIGNTRTIERVMINGRWVSEVER
jgi:cytosine/adenosine deaminase-related metal-dependent hydrolase